MMNEREVSELLTLDNSVIYGEIAFPQVFFVCSLSLSLSLSL
jgi:hypothetical protein